MSEKNEPRPLEADEAEKIREILRLKKIAREAVEEEVSVRGELKAITTRIERRLEGIERRKAGSERKEMIVKGRSGAGKSSFLRNSITGKLLLASLWAGSSKSEKVEGDDTLFYAVDLADFDEHIYGVQLEVNQSSETTHNNEDDILDRLLEADLRGLVQYMDDANKRIEQALSAK